MKLFFATVFAFLTLNLLGQDRISTKLVSQFTSTFSIKNFKMKGEGADMLKERFQESQFVLLGETHDNAEISIFTSSIIPILNRTGYSYFFTENGNNGLQEMIDRIKSDSTIQKDISDFYKLEYNRLGDIPIPFFTGIEDAHFLAEALENKMTIKGIDQEYFYSHPMLFDALFNLSTKTSKIAEAHRIATEYMLNEYEQERVVKNYPICTNVLNSSEVNNFFDLLDTTDVKTKTIIRDIKTSLSIYESNRLDRQKSYVERGNLMNDQFNKFYENIEDTAEGKPKILIKMGAMHTMCGKTPLGIYDIGEHVSNLALQNGSKDLNLFFIFRYYIDEEEPLGYFDNSEGNSKWLTERKAFMEQGDVEEWSIIDLKKLNKIIKSKNVFVYEPLRKIISHHDFVIIPPASKDVELNYKK